MALRWAASRVSVSRLVPGVARGEDLCGTGMVGVVGIIVGAVVAQIHEVAHAHARGNAEPRLVPGG
jgi:hypothetical protein